MENPDQPPVIDAISDEKARSDVVDQPPGPASSPFFFTADDLLESQVSSEERKLAVNHVQTMLRGKGHRSALSAMKSLLLSITETTEASRCLVVGIFYLAAFWVNKKNNDCIHSPERNSASWFLDALRIRNTAAVYFTDMV